MIKKYLSESWHLNGNQVKGKEWEDLPTAKIMSLICYSALLSSSQQDPHGHMLLGTPGSTKLAEDRKHRLRASAIIISGWENLEHPKTEGGRGEKMRFRFREKRSCSRFWDQARGSGHRFECWLFCLSAVWPWAVHLWEIHYLIPKIGIVIIVSYNPILVCPQGLAQHLRNSKCLVNISYYY